MTFGARIRGDLVFGCCLVPRHHWRFWQEIVARWHKICKSHRAQNDKWWPDFDCAVPNGVCFMPPVLCAESPVVAGLLQRPAAVSATSRRLGSNFTPVSSVQCSPASLWSHNFWQIHNFSQWLGVSCDGDGSSSLGCRIISVVTQQRSKSANPPTHRAAGPHNYTVRAIGELSYFIFRDAKIILLDPSKR